MPVLNSADNLYLGSSIADRVYLGTSLVWPSVLAALITQLFSAGEQGAIYVPRPIVLGAQALFQDASGTVPVTADGDPNGLLLDQSQRLVLGPELNSDVEFNDAAVWSDISNNLNTSVVSGLAVWNASPSGSRIASNSNNQLTVGRTYKCTLEIATISEGSISSHRDFGDNFTPNFSTVGTYIYYAVAIAARHPELRCIGTTTATVSRYSVRELYGTHAAQSISSRRLTYNVNPPRLSLDKVDDALVINVPTGGWTGTMVLATDEGTASYGISIPAGAYELGGQFFPGNAIVGAVFRGGALTNSETEKLEKYFVENGATANYGEITNFTHFWRGRSEITSFPLIDTSSGINLTRSWTNCISLTSFPLLDTSSAITFVQPWSGCTSLISFPILNTSSGNNFFGAWSSCTSLTIFPSNFFDNIKGGAFNGAFARTNLNQTSIDGILASLVTSGIAAGTRVFDQSGGSAPSVGTGQPAIDTLRSRGWTVTVTGGY